MSKNLIILTISVVVAISISIGVYNSVKTDQVVIETPAPVVVIEKTAEPDWKAVEAQEKKVGINRAGAVINP
jgi:endonuclease V-like protein UPF0215 family